MNATTIEDLIQELPDAESWLTSRGVDLLSCRTRSASEILRESGVTLGELRTLVRITPERQSNRKDE